MTETGIGNASGIRCEGYYKVLLDSGIIDTRTNDKTALMASKESIEAMRNLWRAVIEIAFIVFLFYSNLLMGEFERSGMGQRRGLAWAIGDVLTRANFEIAMIAALIGYAFFEFLRKKL